jgi:histidinol-phosphate aminotransferase
MFDLNKLIRPEIARLNAYQSARHEFSGQADTFLDANENSLGSAGFLKACYNRYPDPLQFALKKKIAAIKNLTTEEIFLGNGSDEIIDLIIRAFCKPGQDEMIIMPPTYGMYEVCGNINNIKCRKVMLDKTFQIEKENVFKAIRNNTKLIFICSPNNPTGNSIKTKDIQYLIEKFDGIVVLDEAYIDFSTNESLLEKKRKYPNLVVIQTLSKAWGLAGIRLGMGFADKKIISILNKIKAPYNVNQLTQEVAIHAIENYVQKDIFVQTIKDQRLLLEKYIPELPGVCKLYPSDSNFLLVEVKSAGELYNYFLSKGIVVRNRSNLPGCKNCIRITVGNPEENMRLLQAWSEYNRPGKKALKLNLKTNDFIKKHPDLKINRTAAVKRKTLETDISIEINLDGRGLYNISTGIGFFDHLLQQLAKHSGIDMNIKVKGDLIVDEHHSIEDVALVLGEAFKLAIGERKGMERYGFCLPMDDCLAQAAIDFGGRSWLEWNTVFKREKIGEMAAEMFYHFFKSFCDSARCNLNIKAEGSNEHHKIEAIFKAFARAIKAAIRKDNENNELPTTKGII